jgi:hypothetical protein
LPGEDQVVWKYQEESQSYSKTGGTRVCDNNQAKTASHVLCKCDDLAKLRPRHCGKYFMKPCDHSVMQDIAVCRRYRTTEKDGECTIDQKMVMVQGSSSRPPHLYSFFQMLESLWWG